MDTKLLLTCIYKDDSEIELATRQLASFMPHFQGLAVGITGTTGKTEQLKALVRKHGGEYVRMTPETHPKIYHNGQFADFAGARNEVFNLASKMQEKTAFDYWSWADVDDVLINGQELSLVAQKAKQIKADCVFFTYWYSVILDEKGQIKDVAIEHLRERFLKPNTFKWVSRLHEVCVPIEDNYKPNNTAYDFDPKQGRNTVWAHITNETRIVGAMKRNIELLKLQIDEQQRKDPRTVLYLAKTHYDLKSPTDLFEAEKLFHEYLSGPHPSGWAEERSGAWEYLGNIYCLWKDHKKAIDAYIAGLREFPRIMHMISLAKEYMEIDMNDEANFWLEQAMRAEPPRTSTTIGNPILLKIMAASLKYNQAIKQMKLDDAIYWLKIRNDLTGGENVDMIKTLEEAKLLNDAAMWVFNYAKWLKDHGHADKVKDLLKSLPNDLGREQFAFYIANQVNEPKEWDDKSIVFYASWGGEHFEGWSPKSLESGIGGSETAVLELAKRWAKAGYKVTVFNDPREDAGDHDGVTYRPWYEINWKDKFNILILWRSPHLLDFDIKANKLFMDLHDVASQLDWTPERMEKIDKVFFKSKFHRNMIPKLPEEKARVISNGI